MIGEVRLMLTKKEKKELLAELKKELDQPKELYIEICRDNIELPQYANEGDAGMDVRAAVDMIIKPGETVIIPTGLKIAIPEGYEIQVRPRSGLSAKSPLRIPNSPGTIDCGYRDELGIIMENILPVSMLDGWDIEKAPLNNINTKLKDCLKPGVYQIKKGDRIAQLILNKIETIKFIPVEANTINNIGKNRHGGFGHTGTV
jgi:dUTP pyrophosphatase